MFDWNNSGWDNFWRQGEQRMGEELQFYELLTRADLESHIKNTSDEGNDTSND
jgi:hypothetical protein